MASFPLGAESAFVTLPNQYPPMPAVARILSRFDRTQLHGFISIAIELADAFDGDDDLEENGDETDGNMAEDESCRSFELIVSGPGCTIADAAEEDDPSGGNVTDDPHDPMDEDGD